ncbi:MAG: D-alanyl-D-alanine carboxypeptidase, partial [Mesorhizobium sp.]
TAMSRAVVCWTPSGRPEALRKTVLRMPIWRALAVIIAANASSLPPRYSATARDMAVLGMALRARFPQHFHYFSESDFLFRGRLVRGHNDMLGRVRGVNGIKTGYIRASGFNIVTSYDADGRRLILVVMGADSARQRNDHVEALIQRNLSPASNTTTRLLYAQE